MALSGYTDVKVTKYDTLRFSWERTSYSTAENYSVISWKLELIATSYGAIYSSASNKWAVTVDGRNYGGSNSVAISNNTTKTLASDETYIFHNADGSYTFSYAFNQAFNITFSGNYIGTVGGSGSGVLENIPRAATIVSGTDFNDESNPIISFNNPAGFYIVPYLNFYVDDVLVKTLLREAKFYSSPYTWSLTDAERKELRQLIQKNNCYVAEGVETYDLNRKYVGWNSIGKNFSIINAQPTLTPVVKETNEATIALTGSPDKTIKYFNKISAAAGANVYKEASLTALKIINGGVTKYSDDTFTNTADNNFVFKLQDSRGNHTEQTVTLPMVDYIPLTCSVEGKILLDTEDNTKANITITISGNYFKGSFGAVNNALTVSYIVTAKAGEPYTDFITIPDNAFSNGKYEYTYTIPNKFDYQDSYVVGVQATDKLNDITAYSKTLKATPVFDWGESDFNFNVPVSIQNQMINDFVIEQGEKDGWFYRKWQSGKAECWKTVTLNTTIATAWGNMYTGNAKISRQNYPFVFKAKPRETATLTSGTYAAWLYPDGNNGDGVNGAYASAVYGVCRPTITSGAADYYITLYVYGEI